MPMLTHYTKVAGTVFNVAVPAWETAFSPSNRDTTGDLVERMVDVRFVYQALPVAAP